MYDGILPLNISCMSVTFAVLKFDRSKASRYEQPLNISLMSVTFAVFNFETLSEVRDEHSKNI